MSVSAARQSWQISAPARSQPAHRVGDNASSASRAPRPQTVAIRPQTVGRRHPADGSICSDGSSRHNPPYVRSQGGLLIQRYDTPMRSGQGELNPLAGVIRRRAVVVQTKTGSSPRHHPGAACGNGDGDGAFDPGRPSPRHRDPRAAPARLEPRHAEPWQPLPRHPRDAAA